MNLVSEISNDNLQKYSSNSEQLELLPMVLSPVKGKPIIADFDGGNISSNAGLIILKEVEKNIGIIKAIESVLEDRRDSRYVEHQYSEMLSQRVFQIASGYEDANDCNSLKDDPILKICTDKLPLSDNPLASQPTMSSPPEADENTPSRVELYKVAQAMVQNFIDSYTEEPKLIVLDFDDTDNITYGNQQLALFNGYYGET
ncbi:MAG: transposase [Bacteroidetes bacterium]|nr:transposase [Bacteroidota bacterium]